MKTNRTTDEILGGYLEELDLLLLAITGRLVKHGLTVDALIVELWPEFKAQAATYKVWGNGKHLRQPDGCDWKGVALTASALQEIVAKRMILKRKFN